jgi:poly-gamma-glutamate synthesis protein (capsule biosynthesis protein)
LSSLGVDVIIGTHPHVVQPVEYVGDTLVIYSLGNMISAQDVLMKRVGGVAAFTVNKKTVDGKTESVTIDKVKTDLVYTYYNNFQNFKVIPFTKLTDSLLYDYRNIYETYKAYLNPKNDSRIQVGFIE